MQKYRVYVDDRQFIDDKGNAVDYSKLCLTGTINGQILTQEFKLTKTDRMITNLILNTTEDLKSDARQATEDELESFLQENGSDSRD
jgi:hypothetical protein